jgi:hypothetical protein
MEVTRKTKMRQVGLLGPVFQRALKGKEEQAGHEQVKCKAARRGTESRRVIEVCVEVTQKECGLEKDQASDPHGSASSKRRQ